MSRAALTLLTLAVFVPPDAHTYKTVAGRALVVHVFSPAGKVPNRPVAVLFHGGGWAAGSPEWTDGIARDYADRGIVGVSVEYRLSDKKTATPLDALDDARDAVRWVRQNAAMLGIDPGRLIAHGVSAGGQLAVMTALSGDAATVPQALVLWSPGIAVSSDPYFVGLIGDRAKADAVSPDLQVRKGMPATVMVSGEEDVVTPDADARKFCERIVSLGGRCEFLHYPGVGHLLTRNLEPKAQFGGNFDYDPVSTADAEARVWTFLRSLGYLRP